MSRTIVITHKINCAHEQYLFEHFWGQERFFAFRYVGRSPKCGRPSLFCPSQRYERKLVKVRRNLEDLAHDLLAAKKLQELNTYGRAIGSSEEPEDDEEIKKEVETFNRSMVAPMGQKKTGVEHSAKMGPVANHEIDLSQIKTSAVQPLTATDDAAAASLQKTTVQCSGETLTIVDPAAVQGQTTVQRAHIIMPSPAPTQTAITKSEIKVGGEQTGTNKRDLGVLPVALAESIGQRAFPLAEGGISCEAFHALAAEAVWAGLNGSECVQKPPESVWKTRGGDRWGTAAFFAVCLGNPQDEAVPGLPSATIPLAKNNVEDIGDDDCQHPLSGSSARHARAYARHLSSMSSKRAFLKQANDAATKEVNILSCPRPSTCVCCSFCSYEENRTASMVTRNKETFEFFFVGVLCRGFLSSLRLASSTSTPLPYFGKH